MFYDEPRYEIIATKEKDVIKTSGLSLKAADYNTESGNWNEQWNALLGQE